MGHPTPRGRTSFPDPGNDWARRAEMWSMAGDQLATTKVLYRAMPFPHVMNEAHLQARACTFLFYISGITGDVVLKYGVLLDSFTTDVTKIDITQKFSSDHFQAFLEGINLMPEKLYKKNSGAVHRPFWII